VIPKKRLVQKLTKIVIIPDGGGRDAHLVSGLETCCYDYDCYNYYLGLTGIQGHMELDESDFDVHLERIQIGDMAPQTRTFLVHNTGPAPVPYEIDVEPLRNSVRENYGFEVCHTNPHHPLVAMVLA
jgi:hypothetical protein